jgi:hypothetical protein
VDDESRFRVKRRIISAMTSETCTCEPWKLRDPQGALRAIGRRTSLEMGRSYLAAFDLAGGLIGIRKLPISFERQTERWKIGRKFIEPAATKLLTMPGERPPKRVTHLIRCRDSRAVFGLHDYDFAYALMYGIQMLDTFTGELIVVTPHGWTAGPRWGMGTPTFDELSRRLTAV